MRTGKLSACTKHYATLNCQMTAWEVWGSMICVSQNRWFDQVSSFSIVPCRVVTRPNSGGRGKILTDQQEQAVVDLVRARNDIRLTEICQHILDNEDMFNNVGSISLQTIARILKRHQVSIKQLYHVPFERNADRVKQMRTAYVQVSSVSRWLL